MSRQFTEASSQYLYRTSAVVSGYPFTVAGWFRTATTGADCLFGIGRSSDPAYYLVRILARGDLSNVISAARSGTEGVGEMTSGGSTYTSNTWTHFAYVARSATDTQLYLSGSSAGTDTTNVTAPTGLDRTSIGRLFRGTDSELFYEGLAAHIAVWSADKTSNIAALAGGANPLAYTTGLVSYWLVDGTGTDNDQYGTNHLTDSGSTTDGASDPTVDAPPSSAVGSLTNGRTINSILRGRLATP